MAHPVLERRRGDGVAENGEEIGRGAFAGLAALVQQQRFVEAGLVRVLVPHQVHRPRQDLGAGERPSGEAGIGDNHQTGLAAPVVALGGEGDQIDVQLRGRDLPDRAAIANDGDAQDGVEIALGGDLEAD